MAKRKPKTPRPPKRKRRPRKPAKSGEPQVLRNAKGQFPPGVSGNPAGPKVGTRHGLKFLVEALNRIEEKHGLNAIEVFIERAMARSDTLAAKIIDKLVASPKQIEIIDEGDRRLKKRRLVFTRVQKEAPAK